MRHKLRPIALSAIVASVMLGGCAGMMQQSRSQSAYDQSRGPLTVSFDNKIYQSRGDALPLREDQLIRVGTSQGYTIYQLRGGGGGPKPNTETIFVRTTDGNYLTLVRVQP